MFMLLAVCPVADRFGSTFEMNRKAVAAHAGIGRLVAEVQVESKLVAVIRDCSVEIVHQKLRRDSKDLCGTGHCLCDHLDPPSCSCTNRPNGWPLVRRAISFKLKAKDYLRNMLSRRQ